MLTSQTSGMWLKAPASVRSLESIHVLKHVILDGARWSCPVAESGQERPQAAGQMLLWSHPTAKKDPRTTQEGLKQVAASLNI